MGRQGPDSVRIGVMIRRKLLNHVNVYIPVRSLEAVNGTPASTEGWHGRLTICQRSSNTVATHFKIELCSCRCAYTVSGA